MNIRSRSGLLGFALGLGVAVLALLGLSGVAQGSPGSVQEALAPAAPRLPLVQTAPTESKYVPVTPCRIVDTRAGTGTNGTPFSPQQTRTFYVGGTFGFAPQGGVSGGCGIPVGASAIAATVTAVSPTGSGFIRVWPNGVTEPNATFLNYDGSGISAGGSITINASSAYALKVRNYSGTTNVVIDVTGYYAKPLSALIQSDGVTYDGSSRVINSGRLGVGQYWVQFDRDITYCQGVANTYNTSTYARTDTFSDPSTNRVRVTMYNSVGAVTDSWFYLTVTC